MITIAEKNADSTDPTVKARNVLLEWRKTKQKEATRKRIQEAMKTMRWKDEIEELEELWEKWVRSISHATTVYTLEQLRLATWC